MAVLLRCLRPGRSPGLALICLPYAGGRGSVFHTWGRDLPPFVELYAAELPGRDRLIRHKPFSEMTEQVHDLASALMPHLSGPYAVFGHSMGALVGFELVRELRRRRGPLPGVLFASGHSAPQLDRPQSPLHRLPDRDFLGRLRDLSGIPDEVLANRELLALLLPVLRADFRVCETYLFRREEPLGCRTVALGGRDDPEVSLAQLEAWREQTAGGFRLERFEGGHFFIHSCEKEVLKVLSDELEVLHGLCQRHRSSR